MVPNHDIKATATAVENVELTSCDVGVMRWLEPCWDALPKRARMHALEDAHNQGMGQTVSSHNTTCVGLDEYRAANLAGDTNESVSQLAVGTGTTTPQHSNRGLNTEHARTDVSERLTNGNQLTAKSFLSKNEGNGGTLSEVGLYAGQHLLNHSLFSAVEKTSSKAITFQIRLSFDTTSQ